MDISAFPPTAVDNLKCGKCSNFLSYLPIRICGDNLNICGRCTTPKGTQGIENIAFQTLCKFIRFPCRYKHLGCEEEKQPSEVPSHEENCPFRKISCPLLKINECIWTGAQPQVLAHCKDIHSDMFFAQSNTLDLLETSERYYLQERDSLLLIFHLNYDSEGKILNFETSTSEFEPNPKSYSCELKLHNPTNSKTVEFVSTSFEEVAPNQVDLTSFTTEAQLKFQVTVGDVVIDPNEYLDLEMLAVLKCFICGNYARPPIYNCGANSETLCSGCKTHHQESCRPCASVTRNISLDKMANHLNYPCKNRDNGCRFVSKPEKLDAHHDVCELGIYSCPLSEFSTCPWRGLRQDFRGHVQSCHQLIPNSSQITQRLTLGKMSAQMIKFSGHLFRLGCWRTVDRYHWSVQYVGNCQEEFKYEIEILDPARAGRRLLVRQKCQRLTKKDEIFQQDAKICYFFADQVRDFVVDQVITVKVHIFV